MTREYLKKANEISQNIEHCKNIRQWLDDAWAIQFWDVKENSLLCVSKDDQMNVDGVFFAEIMCFAKDYYEQKIKQFEQEFNEL